MTSKQPPSLTTWMLKHFGSGPNNDTVLGDLAEHYAQNGNAMWYRRQALKAIGVSFFREIRAHKGSVVWALLMGWALWTFYVTSIFPLVTPYFFGGSFGVEILWSQPIGSAMTVLSAPVGISAGMNQKFSFVFAVVLSFIAWAMCGGLAAAAANLHVGRNETGIPAAPKVTVGFHRDRQTAVVLLFAGLTSLLNLLVTGLFVFQLQHRAHGPDAAWISSFVGHLAAYGAASVAGILLGGTLVGGMLNDRSRIVSS